MSLKTNTMSTIGMTGKLKGVPANNGDKRSIGQRYGAVVKKHDIINRLLAQLEANPWNRRNVNFPLGLRGLRGDRRTSALCLPNYV